MYDAISTPPPAMFIPTPAATESADNWDWLRIGVFFWGVVFLMTLVPIVLYGVYHTVLLLQDNSPLYPHQAQINLTFAVVDLLAPPLLLIAFCVLSDRRVRQADPDRRRAALLWLTLALGVVVVLGVGAAVFNYFSYQALLASATASAAASGAAGYSLSASLWSTEIGALIANAESGILLGIALTFVFWRFSRRTGRSWLWGWLGATLIAAFALGFSNQLGVLLAWGSVALSEYADGYTGCSGGAGAGCFGVEAQVWMETAVLPMLLALPLGALIGLPLSAFYRRQLPPRSQASDVAAVAGDRGASARSPQAGSGFIGFLQVLGIAAGSFFAGALVAGGWFYAASLLLGESVGGAAPAGRLAAVAGVELAPFGLLALIAAIRFIRLPRERRPSAGRAGVLALAIALGLAPALVVGIFLLPIGPSGAPGALALGDPSFAFAFSLGALLALIWGMGGPRGAGRILLVALSSWLGFSVLFLTLAGYTYVQIAARTGPQPGCNLGCAALTGAYLLIAISTSFIAVFTSLPLILVGVWMGSWLLRPSSALSTLPVGATQPMAM
ncbi:MAG: hypothetical protein ABI068_17040 [Ktedonobacterales bacterium]